MEAPPDFAVRRGVTDLISLDQAFERSLPRIFVNELSAIEQRILFGFLRLLHFVFVSDQSF